MTNLFRPCRKFLRPSSHGRFGRLSRLSRIRYYHDNVLDHYRNPRNVGSLNENDINVGTGLVGAPACGDVLKLQILVAEGVIVDAKFKAFGCGSAIAASSHTTVLVKGRKLDAVNVTNSEIAKHLSLPPVKLHCSMLAEDAINAAIKDYEQKQIYKKQ